MKEEFYTEFTVVYQQTLKSTYDWSTKRLNSQSKNIKIYVVLNVVF